MMKPKRKIVSRRARPAKEPLSHELIVKTAYELLKEEGTSGMSMRKVAKALDTGPSSLYVYVKNLQELSSYVLDYGLGELVLPELTEGNWKEQLFRALDAYVMLLIEQPGLAELSLQAIPVGTHAFRLNEYLLTVLHKGGITSTSAAWGMDLLLLYVSSVAFEKAARSRHGEEQMNAIQRSYQASDPVRFPLIHSLKEELFSGDTVSKERFYWGIEVILNGIVQANGLQRS
ncbi:MULTISPECIES: TetR/AcrR family transcriptional regulator [Paenibacillaceae]|uniref:TetR/AcrR family transcriptional regulator n=1 Tax=Paenibacillaceae TaxID=186822 RepID=UPI0013E40308|nr:MULTISPECIES: TetR/AcrR family transcriptional regulator [Paenibacillaceae]MCM3271689.1 TetR/AcrR family transcriptional regulator [Paenibacillus elgii]NRR05692.1 TetR/AcrR family transcriptional regulator [Brevibacillus sp. RS1.1]GLI07787.1 TetR family transcriptional regulator [Paenibacillus tyrfis]GMX60293.1 TetR/AcrR family transcriptional regulator C-terminal domain-containing protein [Paenibacillus elgii]